MSKTILEIDITDEANEYVKEEPNLSTEDDALTTAMERGYSALKMGRLLPVAWHRGESDFAPEPKYMMHAGYSVDWTSRVGRMMERITLKTGKVISIRRIVGNVPEPEPMDDGDGDSQPPLDLDIETPPGEPPDDGKLKMWNDPTAIHRAHRYLQERIPGYVYGRLKIIAANDGDVWAEIRELQDKLEELGKRLS